LNEGWRLEIFFLFFSTTKKKKKSFLEKKYLFFKYCYSMSEDNNEKSGSFLNRLTRKFVPGILFYNNYFYSLSFCFFFN
jgi:hypothetical protein